MRELSRYKSQRTSSCRTSNAYRSNDQVSGRRRIIYRSVTRYVGMSFRKINKNYAFHTVAGGRVIIIRHTDFKLMMVLMFSERDSKKKIKQCTDHFARTMSTVILELFLLRLPDRNFVIIISIIAIFSLFVAKFVVLLFY